MIACHGGPPRAMKLAIQTGAGGCYQDRFTCALQNQINNTASGGSISQHNDAASLPP